MMPQRYKIICALTNLSKKKVGLMSHQSYKWNHIILLSFHLNSRVSHDGDRNAHALLVESHGDVGLRGAVCRQTCIWIDAGSTIIVASDLGRFNVSSETHVDAFFGEVGDGVFHVHFEFRSVDVLGLGAIPFAAFRKNHVGKLDNDVGKLVHA